ncbi:MAG: hypothetical protein PQJ59_13415 [Spirochaetales bacterium]|nr:hypothetical protein [Spirochaetales bacterium]
MKQIIFSLLILFAVGFFLSAETVDFLGETDIANRDVDTVDLGEVGKDKLKLGVSLGYPVSGVTAGWQVGKSLELDLLAGAWEDDKFCFGGSAMVSLLDIKIGTEVFPLTAGPFIYTGFGSDDLLVSTGAVGRVEYTFDFKLNLYIESGLALQLTELDDNPVAVPVSLGIRYIF